MSIVMPALHHQMPSFDHHFNQYQYSSSLFSTHEHYPALPASAYSPASSLQVDPRLLSSSFSSHAQALAQQPLPPTSMATAQAGPAAFIPQNEDLHLTLGTHFTQSPIPPLAAGSRNRPRPNKRFHSFSNTPATTFMQRRSTDPARGAQTTNQRISRQQRPFTASHGQSNSPESENSETRVAKRRRTVVNDQNLGQHFTAALPATHQQQQQHHNPQLHEHGFGASQTWAGPPAGTHHITSAVLPITGNHGLHQNAVGVPHWPQVALHHYYPSTDHTQHAFHESPRELSSQPMVPFESPTSLTGSPFFPTPISPVQAVSPSGDSVHSIAKKLEPASPNLSQEPSSTESFNHPPTEFPPRPYLGAKSPWAPVKPVGKIFGSRLEQMPAIEQRLAKLEENLDQYLDVRAAQALRNSQLPGLSFDPAPIQAKPSGPSRFFGGRIWPTALARRVRRTPRE